MSYIIMTDTSANLPTEEAIQNGIVVIPLSYIIDGNSHTCLDSNSFQCSDYYSMLKSGVKVTTSQINPQKYVEFMEPALKEGNDILFIGMSSGISGSYGSAETAKLHLLDQYPDRRIYLVDSLGASLGEGLLVKEAITRKKEGMEIEQLAEYLVQKRKYMYQLFTVDDLMYLRRGGRLSNASALVGTLLNVKPLLKGNENGKIVITGKLRGRNRVIEQLAARYEELVVSPETQIVGISHANCFEDAEKLASLLKRKCPPKEIMIVEHEPVTGSYLGSGALALYFMGNAEVRKQ